MPICYVNDRVLRYPINTAEDIILKKLYFLRVRVPTSVTSRVYEKINNKRHTPKYIPTHTAYKIILDEFFQKEGVSLLPPPLFNKTEESQKVTHLLYIIGYLYEAITITSLTNKLSKNKVVNYILTDFINQP